MRSPTHPFAPPASASRRRCLAALALAGFTLLAGASLTALAAASWRATAACRPSQPAGWTVRPAPSRLAAARLSWGEIRARYRDTHRWVPA